MSYEAVVYDLDGTLVRLAVDWDATRQTVVDRLAAYDVDADEMNLWNLLTWAEGTEAEGVVGAGIADHEEAGAASATRLPTADELPRSIPVGVCSLNCEAACRTALERHDLGAHVDAVVGRDSVPGRKPEPEPLLETIKRLGASPDETVFVGDSPRDEEAAQRAGVAFEYVADRTDG